ncbi:MAG: acyl-CoA thioesterase [Woeseiaceae bacterium]
MTFVFDEAIQVSARSADTFSFATDQRYFNFDSAFGGWLAAAMLACTESHADYRGQLVTQDMHFHASVRAPRLICRVELLERRRSLDFWHVRCFTEQGDQVLASANLVCGANTESSNQYAQAPKAVRTVEEAYPLTQDGTRPQWFAHYDIRLAKGRPFAANETLESVTWLRDADSRPLDVRAVTAIVDTPMPRTFFLSEKRVFASTVSLSTHLYASEAEISAVGSDFVRLDTTSHGVRNSLINAESYLYRTDGLLLACSYQTALFRE